MSQAYDTDYATTLIEKTVKGQPCEFDNKDTSALISLPETPSDTATVVEIVLK